MARSDPRHFFLCAGIGVRVSDYMIGYGSLLSSYSRRTYSKIESVIRPVVATGWRRGWTVRYGDEAATYAGVRQAPGQVLHAALVPTRITAELRHRERGYVFTEVDPATVHPAGSDKSALPDGRYWIVVNREQLRADSAHPIPQTYVDTCLAGCLETGGEARARAFIEATELWDAPWVNDRDSAAPLYPRRTPLDAGDRALVDRLLLACGVLKYRQPV
ncbi:hypothetical protein AWH62_01840 [Maricaulis sp. W15]|uniref:Gamma-glutamylcyclotransferase n=1 Tax=Maricaulis maris TaxID=74318 RepID=A0A495DMI2_9PROT|nr:hypothetical protein AWH62_01840 [Maricaulis sp. W15]RKR03840.1 hypothetical protein C7435_0282 [Maricaulis maris]